jgi:Phosphotransferase enzyme family
MNHGDIHPRNFLIDPKTGQVTIIDFGDISALPRSFVSFTLYTDKSDFIAAIARSLSWEKSENIRAMGAAAGILIMLSGNLGTPHFCLMLFFELTMAKGLNERGLPANGTKSRLSSPLSAPSAMVQAPILQQ